MTTEHQREYDELDLIIARRLRIPPRGAPPAAIPTPARDEPHDDELLLFLDGQLSSRDASALEARLTTHPFSQARLEILREAIAEARDEASDVARDVASSGATALQPTPSPSSSTFARLVFALHHGADNILSFVRGTDAPLHLTPAISPTRGDPLPSGDPPTGETIYRFERRFGTCDALIHVERLPGQGVDIRVELSQEDAPLTNARASLRRHGKLIESLRIRDGHVDFVNITPSTAYEVELQRHGKLFGTLRLDFLAA